MNNRKDFKLVRIYRKVSASDWAKYYEYKKIESVKRTETHKFFLKQFRKQLLVVPPKYTLIHVPTGLKHELILKTTSDKPNREQAKQELIEKIRAYRKKMKDLRPKINEFDGAIYKTIGGVFTDKREILKLAPLLSTNDPLKDKRPRSPTKNYIGVELEFNRHGSDPHTTTTIADLLKKENLAKFVSVTTDPSCGFEVRVLLEEDNFEESLHKIMTVLKNKGFSTEYNCGTHVHFDMRRRDIKTVYKNLFYTQKFLRKFLTRARKHNQFCQLNKLDSFDAHYEAQTVRGNRYYGINTLSYSKHKTIEIRMHHGTLDADVLIPYIKMVLTIINYSGELKKNILTLKQAKAAFGLNDDFTKTLATRISSVFGKVLNF